MTSVLADITADLEQVRAATVLVLSRWREVEVLAVDLAAGRPARVALTTTRGGL